MNSLEALKLLLELEVIQYMKDLNAVFMEMELDNQTAPQLPSFFVSIPPIHVCCVTGTKPCKRLYFNRRLGV